MLLLTTYYLPLTCAFVQFLNHPFLNGGVSVLNILTIIKLRLLPLQKLKTSGPEMIQLFLCYLVFGYVVSEHPKT